MMGPRLAHKSEAGAVALGLTTETALLGALAVMREAVRAHDPLALTDRFLIEAMAPRPMAELLVNLRRDAQFGLVMTLGAGGVLVELLQDAETLLLPSREADILAALQRLKIARLLNGFRGGPKADMPALAGFLARLAATFAATFAAKAGALTEVEINPLFITETEFWVVDALIQITSPQ